MTLTQELSAPRSSVWAVLADYANVADWNPTIKKSHSTSDSAEGVGATRHCDLAPLGTTEERIVESVPGERMVVNVDQSTMAPFKTAQMTFALEGRGEATSVTMSFDFEPRGGRFASKLGKKMEKRLSVKAVSVLAGLEKAAQELAVTGR